MVAMVTKQQGLITSIFLESSENKPNTSQILNFLEQKVHEIAGRGVGAKGLDQEGLRI